MGHYLPDLQRQLDAAVLHPGPAPIGPGLAWMPLSFIGTFGAVIRIKAPSPTTRCCSTSASPAAVRVRGGLHRDGAGRARATFRPSATDRTAVRRALIFQLIARVPSGGAAGHQLPPSPARPCRLVRLPVTALNLMPVDSSTADVAYAILRRRRSPPLRPGHGTRPALYSPLWLAWMVVMIVISSGTRYARRPRPVGQPHPRRDRGCGVRACFTPKPLLISWTDFLGSFRQALHF
jgi:hypothetical protein